MVLDVLKKFQSILHFFFPSLCACCKEVCSTRFFCSECWKLCELPDPVGRCQHCFEELVRDEDICRECRKNRKLFSTRAYVFHPDSPAHLLGYDEPKILASFAMVQWIFLEWPFPDVIVPMPDSFLLADEFAKYLDLPVTLALSFEGEYRKGRIGKDQTILLIDLSNPLEFLEKAEKSLAEAFPKRVYLLSLYPKC